jgi:hypothetical protein
MKIISSADVFIRGIYCAAGVPLEVEDEHAKELIVANIVRRAPDEIATAPAAEIETAAAATAAENAAMSADKKRK